MVLFAPTVVEPIELVGCANFRDVGGVTTANGGQVQQPASVPIECTGRRDASRPRG